jgi:hypothetical protein
MNSQTEHFVKISLKKLLNDLQAENLHVFLWKECLFSRSIISVIIRLFIFVSIKSLVIDD